MDSEKHTDMRELLEKGRPVTDEGPYYHHAWWESYKSGVKGKLGGGVLGAGIGAVTGLIAVAALPIVAPAIAITTTLVSATAAGFAAAGMLYGVHEFAEVGKVTGAVASTQKTAEKRMKAFEESKFAEIKEEIGELKALIKGEPVPEKTAAAEAAALKEAQDDYRTSHFQGATPGADTLVYWKLALTGLVVGVLAGAVLAYGGMAATILHGLGIAATKEGLGLTGNYIASITAMGAVGASFGINRDIFRQVFDKTDLWFRGFVSHAHSRTVLLDSPAQQQTVEKQAENKQPVLFDGHIHYPESDTHFRDQQLARARQALMEMDHTHMSPH